MPITTSHCELCDQDVENYRITPHLNSCIRRHVTHKPQDKDHEISTAPPIDSVCHIRVRSQHPDDLHRLHLLARPDTTLADLDRAIRQTWTEPCCGTSHDSLIRKSWAVFSSRPQDGEHSMDQTLAHLWSIKGSGPEYTFDPDLPFVCNMDQFGLWRAYSDTPLRLLARNNPGEHPCQTCERPATRAFTKFRPKKPVTMTIFRCDPCAAATQDVWLPAFNSPRAGACRYRARSMKD